MLLDDILEHNQQFVEKKSYQLYQADRIPKKHAVIVTCMDTRLIELLPKAMNFKNGDVKILKTAGAIIKNPFGSIMRSILVAVHSLEANEVYIVGHHDCGMSNLDPNELIEEMKNNGIEEENFNQADVNVKEWLQGFDQIEDSVKSSVDLINNHPFLPNDLPVHGLVIDPKTGKLDLVVNGYHK